MGSTTGGAAALTRRGGTPGGAVGPSAAMPAALGWEHILHRAVSAGSSGGALSYAERLTGWESAWRVPRPALPHSPCDRLAGLPAQQLGSSWWARGCAVQAAILQKATLTWRATARQCLFTQSSAA